MLIYTYVILHLVPLPNVTVTALSNEQVGQPLSLSCNVTTVRGITSNMDIVWIADGVVIKSVNVSGKTVNNTVVYYHTYNHNGSFLSEDDNSTTYQCSVTIESFPSVNNSDYHVLNLTSKSSFTHIHFLRDHCFNLKTPLIKLPNAAHYISFIELLKFACVQ